MSTLAYAALTKRREDAQPNTSVTQAPPGVGTWVDSLAALVPAEVLAALGFLLSLMTEKTSDGATIITAVTELRFTFYALALLSVLLYVSGRLLSGKWDYGTAYGERFRRPSVRDLSS